MINLKALAKLISKENLWDKPLCQFSEEEVLKLASAFVAAQLDQEKTCGSCWYFTFKGFKGICVHPDHPNWVPSWSWGLGCDDWAYLFDKEFGSRKLNRKPKCDCT
jgi:hypothetical protein